MLRPMLIALIVLVGATAAGAQLVPRLPALPIDVPGLPAARGLADDVLRAPSDAARMLDQARRAAIARLVRDNPHSIALDPEGFPARAGEVVIDDPKDAVIAAAVAKGYRVIERGDVLGVGYVRLAVPGQQSLPSAIREIRKLGGEVSADQLHMPSGATDGRPASVANGGGTLIGVIDGGVAGAAISTGFAIGAPRDNDHATAVASLIGGSGKVRGGLPGARIASADVYGSDPAGGNATAIAKALGWMVQQRVSVVTISLVGPANPLLAKVVAAAQARGLVIVAAVGNNGPAAPPGFPASYPGVIAVTGVDGRNRALIEAGRASHLDYAAPGADMLAAGIAGRVFRVRGTSFAAPLVAATTARFYPSPSPAAVGAALKRVDALARDLGPRGPDRIYGRGLVCGDCRTLAK
ncbi:S8 family serine peptidase [Sphingomonas pruni]|uniref:S8 family serine peptidase n=1 Tax=Sphingomonas pruni TaxID=40683 RepID=UPI000B28D86D|nr:S8 family serine peptidase [Sphingomonas pruni]